MGGFSSLPALAIKQPESPLDSYGKAMQLKALSGQIAAQPAELELQKQKIEIQKRMLNDQAAGTAATKEWAEGQGKISMDDIPKLMMKHGASVQAATDVGNKLLEQAKTYQSYTAEQRKNAIAVATAINDAAADVLHLPDELQPQAHAQKQQELVQVGIIKPDHVEPYDKDRLKMHAAGSAHEKQFLEEEDKKATAAAAMLRAQAADKAADKPPTEVADIADYTKTYLAAKNLPNTPSNQLLARDAYYKSKQPFGAAKIEIAREGLNAREEKDARTESRKDTDFIDKNYVKPANDVEKSYQMFMEAYANRNNAKTGAESMLALSTHLATTFGNVKGSRVTKDMIEHHLGARKIGDSALVAVQKLTNGDVLSPDQWDAFKGLISNSRNLTWQTTQKEAKRRNVDISGSLPGDFKGGSATTPTTIRARDTNGQLHEAPAGTKLPPGWKLEQ